MPGSFQDTSRLFSSTPNLYPLRQAKSDQLMEVSEAAPILHTHTHTLAVTLGQRSGRCRLEWPQALQPIPNAPR